MINGYTKLAAVIGNPMKHSLSPFIWNHAFELTGINGAYMAWEVKESDLSGKKDTHLSQVLGNIRNLDMYGVNLSMPYKQLAMWYVNELTDSARLIGAINTITNEKGKLIGHNTDGVGFFKALSVQGINIRDKEIIVLGGGGAALAIIVEACLLGAKRVHVFNRQSEHFEVLRQKLLTISQKTGVEIILQDLKLFSILQESLYTSSLLANGTSVGMDGVSSPLSDKLKLPSALTVADTIYKGGNTPLIKWARSQGNTALNGLGMVLYQAAENFKRWTGQEMPVEKIGRELEAELAKKQSTIFSGGLSQSSEDGQ